MTDSDSNHSRQAPPFLTQSTVARPEPIVADPAQTALKRKLLDEALYLDDLHDRTGPMPDDMDA